MFRINIEPVINSGTYLESQASELQQMNTDLDGIIRSLSSFSSLGEQVSRLRNQKKALEEEQSGLWQMAQGLDKTVFCYIHCENRICDNAEEQTVPFVVKNDYSYR